MGNISIWIIFGIIALILLVIFWGRRNAVWGGLTIGIILGFVVTLFFVFKDSGFNWYIIGKGAILGTMSGFIAELLGKLFDFLKRRS